MILTLLVLPTVIIAAREAIRAVPDSIRQGALRARGDAVADGLAPGAAGRVPGIVTGSILALSRAIGETAPLLMVGAVTYVSFDPTILRAVHRAADPDLQLTCGCPRRSSSCSPPPAIIVLLALLLTMNAIAICLRNRYQENAGDDDDANERLRSSR